MIKDHETGSTGAATPQIYKTGESCVIASSMVGGVVLMILFLALILLIIVKILRQTIKKKCKLLNFAKVMINIIIKDKSAAFRREGNVLEHQRNTRCRDVSTSLKIQPSKPIYEGAIYKATPGKSVKTLLDSTNCPNSYSFS